VLGVMVIVGLAAVLTVVGLDWHRDDHTHSATGHSTAGKPVCGQPVLRSPFNYDGPAGPYASGTPGLPTFGTPGSDFPHDTAGVVLPTGRRSYLSYQLRPRTVYYLLPGKHVSTFMANTGDAFVGGFAKGRASVISGEYRPEMSWAIDSNSTDGDQAGVTIEYLTIEKFRPDGNAAAINQDANTDWTMRYNTIRLNVPGAGAILGAGATLEHNCLTLNGQYGFQSVATNSWGRDSLTDGAYDVTVRNNEISYNDTCDFSGLLSNPAAGWSKHNPVPKRYRNPHCGKVVPNGNQGGFKLWQTDGVTIANNFIHNNWGPGIWADTNNANTTYAGNTITNNEGPAIIEEISYNFSITDNYIADNGWVDGLGNESFPTAAIYISESGSDGTFGGVPACPEVSCADQKSYRHRSVISRNRLVDNSGSVFLWQNSNRFCSDGFDGVCTLVGDRSGHFTMSGCKANLASASIGTRRYVGNVTGFPARNWWDGCMWKTANVVISHNTISFSPARVAYCSREAWPACGAGGIFSQYGSAAPYDSPAIATQLTFFQGNSWSDNTYNGPSTFYAWNQGNGENPVSWSDWTGAVSGGQRCGSPGEQSSGYCTGPFGQDAGSAYFRHYKEGRR
jgi:parallel beta-helix repeat protein